MLASGAEFADSISQRAGPDPSADTRVGIEPVLLHSKARRRICQASPVAERSIEQCTPGRELLIG